MSYDAFTNSGGYYSIPNVSSIDEIVDGMLSWPLRAPVAGYTGGNVPYGFTGYNGGFFYSNTGPTGPSISDNDGKTCASFNGGNVYSNGYYFSSDDDTGLVSNGSGQIAIKNNGFTWHIISPQQIQAYNQTNPLLPSYSFFGSSEKGWYSPEANTIGMSIGGTGMYLFSPTGIRFESSSLSLSILGTPALTLTSALVNTDLDLRAKSFYFSQDTDTGLSRNLSNQIDLVCGGTTSVNFSVNGVKVLDGSAINPSYGYINDTNSGWFSGGNNIVSCSAGGTERFSITDSYVTSNVQIRASAGAETLPSYSWADTNTGMYNPSADAIGLTTGSTNKLLIDTNITAQNSARFITTSGSASSPGFQCSTTGNGMYLSTTNTLGLSTNSSARLLLDTNLTSQNNCRFLGPTTGGSIPGFSWWSDQDTGVFWNGADSLGISQGGIGRWVWNSSFNYQPGSDNSYDIGTTTTRCRNIYSARFLGATGSTASAPTFGFNGDGGNDGMYLSSANTLTFSTNSTGRVSINTANLITDLPIIAPAGSTGSVSYGFNSDTDTGFFSYSANQIGISCGATLVGRFFNSGFVMNGNIFTNLTPSGGTLHWYLRTNGSVLRNAIGMSATESGSDTGSNLAFWNYTDAGGFKAQIYENERSTNNNYFWGRLWVGQTASTTVPSIGFLNQTDCGLSSYYTDQVDIITNSVHRFSITNNSILPAVDASYNLGSSGLRMNTIYASVGAINTSDKNLKDDITDCPLGLEFVNKLKPKKYKWKDRTYEEKYYDEEAKEEKVRVIEKTHSRYHRGLLAQDVKQSLDELGINTNDFAGYVDSSINEPDKPPTYGLNYTQFIPCLIKSIQELNGLVNSLKARIEVLEENNNT